MQENDEFLTVHFKGPITDGGRAITHHVIHLEPEGRDEIVSGPSPALISKLTNGTEYTLTIAAVSEAGQGPFSAPLVAKPGEYLDLPQP